MKNRFMVILLTLLFYCPNFALYSQSITLNISNVTLKEALDVVRDQSGYSFVYEASDIDTKKVISISVKQQSIEDVMKQMLQGQNLSYEIKNKNIIISQKKANKNIDFKNRRLTGVVYDDRGQTIIGATIKIVGTSLVFATDNDGKFSVPEVPSDAKISISYVGMKTKTVSINGQSKLNIVLEESSIDLKEVVAIGYGTQKKSDITGSVAMISAKDFKNHPVADANQAMQGKVAGVMVTQNSGSPGSDATVRIRGIGTVNNSDPLYVVDGMSVGSIAFLNPSDIESISVLKDASSAAIYGARAANGVILITTKQGKSGKTVVNFTSYKGVQQVWKKIDMLNAHQWANAVNEANINSGLFAQYPNVDNLPINRDFQDEIFKVAQISDYNLSISGGDSKTIFALSANYFSQDGIIKNSDFARTTFRSNAQHTLAKWIKIGENLSFSNSIKHNFSENNEYSGVLNMAVSRDPLTPLYDTNGEFISTNITNFGNPLAQLKYSNNNEFNINDIVGNFYIELTPSKPFKVRSSFGLTRQSVDYTGFSYKYFLDADENNPENKLTKRHTNILNWVWENTINYSKTIGDHDINALIGFTMQNNINEYFMAQAKNLPYQDDPQMRTIDAGITSDVEGTRFENSMISYLARLNYAFKSKYLLTANIRRDGSSRFGANNRYGNFPSFALGWKASEEEFLKNIGSINVLKFRAGWGRIGNENIGNYGYSTYASYNQDYTLGGSDGTQTRALGLAFLKPGNPNIQWESTETLNGGFDFSLWKNKLNFTFDLFSRNTEKMLVEAPVPGHVGAQVNPWVNAGKVSNTGFEFTTEYRKQEGKFHYAINFNISSFKNTVKSLGSTDTSYISSGNFLQLGSTNRTAVGHSIGEFYGYVVNKVFQKSDDTNNDGYVDNQPFTVDPTSGKKIYAQPKAQPGDLMFKDLNNDGVINDKDRTFIGNPYPKFMYGLNFSADYLNFDFSLFLQGSYGNKVLNGMTALTFNPTLNNVPVYALDRWTSDKESQTTPRFVADDSNNNSRISNYYIQDGSYIRLKNIQLGYTFNLKRSKGMFGTLRTYIMANNLLTFTKYKGFDPEVGNNTSRVLDIAIDRGGVYPQSRLYTIGLNLTF